MTSDPRSLGFDPPPHEHLDPPSILPAKLKDCWELAAKDFKECQTKPKINIDMADWMRVYPSRVSGEERCSVCLAGSVMLNTFKIPISAVRITKYGELKPSQLNISKEDRQRLFALNTLRQGRLWDAIAMVYPNMGGIPTMGIDDADTELRAEQYSGNYDKLHPEEFFAWMQIVQNHLNELDL